MRIIIPEISLENILKIAKEYLGKDYSWATEETSINDLFPEKISQDIEISFMEFIMALEDEFDIFEITEMIATDIRSETISNLLDRLRTMTRVQA